MKSAVGSAILCSIFLCCAAARVKSDIGLRCTPGETVPHSDGCNSCYCSESGYVDSCTEMACNTAAGVQPYTALFRHRCSPGEFYVAGDGCNFCSCTDSGYVGSCTKKDCLGEPEALEDESEAGGIINPFGDKTARVQPYTGVFRRRCSPGEIYVADDGCNHCICPGPGQAAACTQVACIRVSDELEVESDVRGVSSPFQDESFVFENATHCTPDTQFYLGCNVCFCQSSGIKSGSPCDNLGCPPFPPLYDPSLKCTPGMQFMQACNYCTCTSSGIVGDSFCTLMNCGGTHP